MQLFVKMLLDNGAWVYLQEQDGWLALMSASHKGNVQVVKILLENGTQVDLQTSNIFLNTTSLTKLNEIIPLLQKSHDNPIPLNFSPLVLKINAQVTVLLQNGSKLKLIFFSALVNTHDGHNGVVKILLQHNAKICGLISQHKFQYKFTEGNNHERRLKVEDSDMFSSKGMSALMIAAMNRHNSEEPYLCPNCKLEAQKRLLICSGF